MSPVVKGLIPVLRYNNKKNVRLNPWWDDESQNAVNYRKDC